MGMDVGSLSPSSALAPPQLPLKELRVATKRPPLPNPPSKGGEGKTLRSREKFLSQQSAPLLLLWERAQLCGLIAVTFVLDY